MAFNFSSVDTKNVDTFRSSFLGCIRFSVRQFLHQYGNIFNRAEQLIELLEKEQDLLSFLKIMFSVADEAGLKVFVIIDEYDHFANDLIAMVATFGEDFYRKMIMANGLVRDFYENLKIVTDCGIVDQTFITGISPVMLDDLASGYNIATNYSLDLKYNEMLGFTREEVDQMMNEIGIKESQINVDVEYYYNGYLFNEEAVHKVYNASMIIYFFEQILKLEKPKNLIDPNLAAEPNRLNRLMQNDKNRQILIQIIKTGCIVSEVLEKFSIENARTKLNALCPKIRKITKH